MTDDTLQADVAAWHTRRFPKARPGHVAMKAVAELGEVADALLGEDEDVSCGWDGNPAEECADVVLTIMALVGRYYPDADLLGLVRAKLAILTDPDSTHRSALAALVTSIPFTHPPHPYRPEGGL